MTQQKGWSSRLRLYPHQSEGAQRNYGGGPQDCRFLLLPASRSSRRRADQGRIQTLQDSPPINRLSDLWNLGRRAERTKRKSDGRLMSLTKKPVTRDNGCRPPSGPDQVQTTAGGRASTSTSFRPHPVVNLLAMSHRKAGMRVRAPVRNAWYSSR